MVESQIKSPDFISNGWLSKLVSLLIILSILAIENIYLEGGVVKIFEELYSSSQVWYDAK